MVKYRLGTTCVSEIYYHIVFCSKRRKSVLTGDLAVDLEGIVYQAAQKVNTKVENLQINPDHVYLVVKSSALQSPDKIIKQIKKVSAPILMKKYSRQLKLPSMWSSSYYCSTQFDSAAIEKYIKNQKGK